jgi:hypothetical protein
MKLKLRSEGTPINSEIYAKSLAGTEGSAKAEAASQDGPAAAHRRQPKDAGVFVPEGPDCRSRVTPSATNEVRLTETASL